MFPTRGLLSRVKCPDETDRRGSCQRQACPLAHQRVDINEDPSTLFSSQLDAQSETDSTVEPHTGHHETSSGEGDTSQGELQNLSKTHAVAQKRTRADTGDDASDSSAQATRQTPESHLKRPRTSAVPYRSPLNSLSARPHGPRNAYAAAKQQAAQEGRPLPSSASYRAQSTEGDASEERRESTSQSSTSLDTSQSRSNSHKILSAPLIARSQHPSASAVPLALRQSSLRTYFTTFATLYASIVPQTTPSASGSEKRVSLLLKRVVHQLSSEDALASEADVFRMSYSNSLTYRNSVRTSLIGVVRRQKHEKEAHDLGVARKATIDELGLRAQARALALLEDFQLLDDENVSANDRAVEETLAKFLRSSDLIGTTKDFEFKKGQSKERECGRLDRWRLKSANLIASTEMLAKAGYPIPQYAKRELSDAIDRAGLEIEAAWGAGGKLPDLLETKQVCERCTTEFTVQVLDDKSDDDRKEACCYHWGKRRFVRDGGSMRGPRLPRWTCCDALDEATTFASTSLSQIAASSGIISAGEGRDYTAGSSSSRPSGCVRGPHVFKEEDSRNLHERESFISSETLCSRGTDDKSNANQTHKPLQRYDVLALDCELVSTTAGLSLAHLTVLDEAGAIVLDRHVRPRAAILDYNTRFSGIRAADIPAKRDSVNSLEGVRAALCRLMKPDTVLIGHGLENDLKALRLVHTSVADSALLYPHPKGLPYRLSLRELAQAHLGRHIQTNSQDSGHDPEEDARAALDLVRLQFRAMRESRSKAASASAIQSKDNDGPAAMTTSKDGMLPREAAATASSHSTPSSSEAKRMDKGTSVTTQHPVATHQQQPSPGPAAQGVLGRPPKLSVAPSAKASASLFIPRRRPK